MTKAEIVNAIFNELNSKHGTGLVDKNTILTVVEQFMKEVKISLKNNENVYLRGFGSFVVKQRAEKVARNIAKNETITIPAHVIPSFKPAKEFVNEVKGSNKK